VSRIGESLVSVDTTADRNAESFAKYPERIIARSKTLLLDRMRAFREILFNEHTHKIMQMIVDVCNITPADIHIATLGVLDKLLEQLTNEQIKRLDAIILSH